MANRDFLEEFAQIFYAFKQEHDLCDAQISVPLHSLLSVDLCTWFTKYFKKERHRLWLEQVCHLKLEPMRNGVRHLLVTEDSFVDMANVALLTGLDDVYIHRSAFTAATASMVAPAAQPSSPHGHANFAAIVSDSDCDSDLDYNPAAVESEVSSTDDDEEPSVDIMFGARKSWADMDPKSRARAVRKLLPHMKETLLTQLHLNIHSEAGDIMTAIGQAMSTKKRRRKQRRQSGALRMPSNSDRMTEAGASQLVR
jgi:hypothetical protein